MMESLYGVKVNFLKHFKKGYTPRHQQVAALEFLSHFFRHSQKKVAVLDMPVATGKTFVAGAVAEALATMKYKTDYTTANNGLLDQFSRDFPDTPVLKGASHYPCNLFKGTDCGSIRQSVATKQFCKECPVECPYLIARKQCLNANFAGYNSMSFLFQPKQRVLEGSEEIHLVSDVIIVDEYQSLAGLLAGVYDLKLWHHDLEFKEGVSASMPAVVELLKRRERGIETLLMQPQKLTPGQIKMLSNQYRKIGVICAQLSKNALEFVVEEKEDDYRGGKTRCLHIRPISVPSRILRQFFQCHRVILMSGTAFDLNTNDLGFEDFEKFEADSPIDVERRLFHYTPAGKWTYNTQKVMLPKFVAKILEIADQHKNERGIVLCTYSQSVLLEKHLTDPRFKFHKKTDKAELLKSFQNAADNQIAVLCGCWEGLDFKDDIARFTIFFAVPLPNTTDAVVKKRMEMDNESDHPKHWYTMQAMENIVQGSGRNCRHPEDYGVNYMIDAKFLANYLKVRKLLPKSFNEAVRLR